MKYEQVCKILLKILLPPTDILSLTGVPIQSYTCSDSSSSNLSAEFTRITNVLQSSYNSIVEFSPASAKSEKQPTDISFLTSILIQTYNIRTYNKDTERNTKYLL